MNIRWIPRIFLSVAAASLLNSCAGYRLGSMLPPDIKSVHVPTFINKTDEPLVDVETTQATIEQIQLDGSLKIAGPDDADAVLEVTVYDYNLSPIAFRSDRVTQTDEYRVNLTAQILLKRRVSGDVVVEDPAVMGETTFLVTGDLTSAKRQALPEAASDLAKDIVERMVEAW